MSSSTSSSTSESSSTDNDRPERQPARRVFAREYQDATYMFSESDEERAPKFALLPTGARANRVFVVGTLTESEDRGSDSEFWQARVVDPTGTHFIYAGQYQPDAAAQLRSLEPPAYVAVVGKPRSYTNDDGETYTSLTAESLTVVDHAIRDRWVVEAAEHTIDRLTNFRANSPSDDAVMAADQYGEDISPYEDAVVEALENEYAAESDEESSPE